MTRASVVLCILDGVGWGRRDDGDAVYLAQTPHLDRLMASSSWCLLAAHGIAVGMPSDEDMGNSEVGHNAMGAGRVFDQGAKLVSNGIESGRIWTSEAWQRAIQAETLHLIGLVSDGNVHSHVNHLLAMIQRAAASGVRRLRVHALTDGRDVYRRSALTWIEPLEALLSEMDGDYAIGSGGGRMQITMDRYEADWSMVERGWNAHVHGDARRFDSATEAIKTLYTEEPDGDDQYLPAFVVGDYDGMHDGDSAILINFRGDRAVELCQAFDQVDFAPFDRAPQPDVYFAGMMQYDGDLLIPKHYLVQPPDIGNTVADQLAAAAKTTLAISETQKFGHVTYFFNGNRGERPANEAWTEVPSLNLPFDEIPQMCAAAVTEHVVDAITSGEFDLIRVNLANGDMVGHTGNLDATVEAVTFLDTCVGKMIDAVEQAGGVLLVTADHGNADQMFEIDKGTGEYALDAAGARKPRSSHSLNPIPFILFDPTAQHELQGPTGATIQGGIAQIGASLLQLCGVQIPQDYLPSLIRKRDSHG